MDIAILIPCYNEEITIKKVIEDFKKELPDSNIYVYDNNSTDSTYEIAKKSGAIVKKEYRQGKGNVVRSMFRDIDADIYIMVDGDDTYPAEFVHDIIKPIINGEADMTIGDRITNGTYAKENKRNFHGMGNNLVKYLINILFKSNYKDIMTGYRGFNKYFVKNVPIMSLNFEIETEISIHAIDKNFSIKEVSIDYRDRPLGSESKLNTLSDGVKVLKTIFRLFKDYKPFAFFGTLSLISFAFGMFTGIPVIIEFINTHLIEKLPSAVLAASFMIISILLFITGLILDSIYKNFRYSYELQLNKYALNEKAKFEDNICNK